MIFLDRPDGDWIARALEDGTFEFNPNIPDAKERFLAANPTLGKAIVAGVDAKAELSEIRKASTPTEAEAELSRLRDVDNRLKIVLGALRFIVYQYSIEKTDESMRAIGKMFGQNLVDLIYQEPRPPREARQ
jgi:hypothetical protein